MSKHKVATYFVYAKFKTVPVRARQFRHKKDADAYADRLCANKLHFAVYIQKMVDYYDPQTKRFSSKP